MASKLLGMTEVPVDIQQYDSEKEELEDLVADNRISELADVDNKKLYEILKESEGKFETGYTEGEIEAIVANIEIKEEDLTVPPTPSRPHLPFSLLPSAARTAKCRERPCSQLAAERQDRFGFSGVHLVPLLYSNWSLAAL